MINAANGKVTMFGAIEELMTECTAIITSLYQSMSKALGEDTANEILVAMGKAATDPETAKDGLSNVISVAIPSGGGQNENIPILKQKLQGMLINKPITVYQILRRKQYEWYLYSLRKADEMDRPYMAAL